MKYLNYLKKIAIIRKSNKLNEQKALKKRKRERYIERDVKSSFFNAISVQLQTDKYLHRNT